MDVILFQELQQKKCTFVESWQFKKKFKEVQKKIKQETSTKLKTKSKGNSNSNNMEWNAKWHQNKKQNENRLTHGNTTKRESQTWKQNINTNQKKQLAPLRSAQLKTQTTQHRKLPKRNLLATARPSASLPRDVSETATPSVRRRATHGELPSKIWASGLRSGASYSDRRFAVAALFWLGFCLWLKVLLLFFACFFGFWLLLLSWASEPKASEQVILLVCLFFFCFEFFCFSAPSVWLHHTLM